MPEVQQATPRGLSRSFSAGIRAIASPRRHERRALDGSCFCAPRGSTRPPQRSGSRATTASPPGNEMGSWSPIRDGRGMKAFAALERGMRGLRDQAGCPCDAGRGKVRLVEGNENRVSKLPPARMGPGGRGHERGPIPAGLEVKRPGRGADRRHAATRPRGGRVRATIGHGSDSFGTHIEGKPAHARGKGDVLAPRPLTETARAMERPLSYCEPLS